jgi:hypothetical protein
MTGNKVMTTPTEDQNAQEQLNETTAQTEAEEGWNAPDGEPEGQDTPAAGDDAAKEGDGPKDDKAEDNEAAAVEEKPLPAEEQLKAEVKRFRDKYSESKGEAEALRRLAKKLEEDGLLDREELAKEVGIDAAYLNAVLDRKELPEAGEAGHIEQLQSRFKQDYENPVIQRALVKAYGDRDTQLEILKAFDFAVANNPELQEKYKNTSPDDVLYFAMDEGVAALNDFREVEQIGHSPTSMLSEIRRLRAENEELRKKSETVVVTPKEQTDPQEEEPAPKDAREAKLRAFMQ